MNFHLFFLYTHGICYAIKDAVSPHTVLKRITLAVSLEALPCSIYLFHLNGFEMDTILNIMNQQQLTELNGYHLWRMCGAYIWIMTL